MNVPTDPRLQHYNVNLHGLQTNDYQSNIPQQLPADLDPHNFESAFALNSLANASVNSSHSFSPPSNAFAQQISSPGIPVQSRNRPTSRPSQNAANSAATAVSKASPQTHGQTYPTPPRSTTWDVNSAAHNGPSPQAVYMPVISIEEQDRLARGRGGPIFPETLTPKTPQTKEDGSSHFGGMKVIAEPPNLEQWRLRLFHIAETLILSEDEFQTYFPHVDNVYSHRSTQKYKRKPFVSHYWDCRLKGRPPGTPKSDDPAKKKRKRNTRERDLCDVKIKITEYFPSSEAQANGASSPTTASVVDGSTLTFIMENEGNQVPQPFGMLAPSASLPPGHPGANGARWYTIQRVNGNAAGENGNDDLDLDHKHTLEESDKIKKNSVQRWLIKEGKEQKRALQISAQSTKSTVLDSTLSSTMSSPQLSLRASGLAFQTAKRHLAPSSTQITLFANSFCPFAQRVWIALEIKQIPYKYVEVVPKLNAPNVGAYCPPELLEVCPEGIIPCIKHGNWAMWESGILLEYLEDLTMGHSLLPVGKAQLRAHCRLWTDHINRKILPAFYALLLTPPAPSSSDAQQPPHHGSSVSSHTIPALADQHILLATSLTKAITSLVNASHATGPFFLGPSPTFVDVAFAPWIIRLSRVLAHYRHFDSAHIGVRWQTWVDAIEADERVRATVSDEGSYHDVYSAVGEVGREALGVRKGMVEAEYARRVVMEEEFGLGGDVWGIPVEREQQGRQDLN